MEIAILSEDMTPDENKSLQDYISNGCPGLIKIDDSKVFQCLELYMAGKSYAEIAHISKTPRDLIMYISYKAKWCEKRTNYYSEMASGLTNKIRNVKLQSADTVANAITAMGKYFNDSFNKYLSTNDKSVIENLDTKNLTLYYKSLEVLEKIISPSGTSESDKTQVNINLGSGGATVTQVNDKTVDISTNPVESDEAAAELLKSLARYQRAKEKN